MKRNIEQMNLSPKQEKRESEPIYCVSVGSTGDDDESSPLEMRLKTLEQRHRQLNIFYHSKINELAQIIKQQGAKKNELTQELFQLSKLSQEQKQYVNSLKNKLECSPEEHEHNNHHGLAVSAYLMGMPQQPKPDSSRRAGKRGYLFRSGQGKEPLLKHCKSDTEVGNEYYPVAGTNQQERGSKQSKENQRRYNPLLNN